MEPSEAWAVCHECGMHPGAEEKPEILIVGHQWWWEVHYLDARSNDEFTTANEIHIPAHRPINIELQSRDVMHSFWVPSLHGKVDLIPGLPNFIRIEASAAGAYHGQCAEYCGAQHAHMLLLVVAQEPDEYNAWLEQQRKPASEPTTPDAIAGQQTFLCRAVFALPSDTRNPRRRDCRARFDSFAEPPIYRGEFISK